jgi:hypothetical protein
MDDELESMCTEVVVAYFRVLIRYFLSEYNRSKKKFI